MRHFREERWTIEGVSKWLRFQADKSECDGLATLSNRLYLDSCTAAHYPSGTQVILTRDTGHHTSGWWKNPDYERCLHLSLCFRDIETGEPRDQDRQIASRWIEAVFGNAKSLIWTEPPFSKEGKARDVWHYRLFFADEDYTVPILPRGEVYSKEFTDAGWLSWSDLQAKLSEERQKEIENALTP